MRRHLLHLGPSGGAWSQDVHVSETKLSSMKVPSCASGHYVLPQLLCLPAGGTLPAGPSRDSGWPGLGRLHHCWPLAQVFLPAAWQGPQQ